MAHFVNSAARQSLEPLSTDHLFRRLRRLEEAGKEAAKRVAESRGDHCGDTLMIRGGNAVRISGEQVHLNVLRESWKDTVQILIERGAM